MLILYLILLLACNLGLIEFFGFSISISKIIIDLLILLFFSRSLYLHVFQYNSHYNFWGWQYILFYIFITIISFIVNQTSIINLILFLEVVLIPYLLFLAVINSSFSSEHIKFLSKIFLFILILQIPVVIIKFLVIGINESGAVGTFSVNNGNLSTLIPMIAISICLIYYYLFEKYRSLFLIPFFIFFGIVGNKLAILFMIPLIYIIVTLIYNFINSKRNVGKIVLNLFSVFIISIISFYFMIMFSPRINATSDNMIDAATEYISDYLYRDKYRDRENKLSRLTAFPIVVNFIKENKPLIGNGPGVILKSQLTGQSGNLRKTKFNLGYGSKLGMFWFSIQIGVLGFLPILLFMIAIIRHSWRRIYYNNQISNQLFFPFVSLMIGVTILYDIILYSNTSFLHPAIITIFMIISGINLNRYSN